MNLMEAFKALDQLNEDVFSVDAEGIKKLNDFMQNDDSVDELSVFDIDSTEDDVIRDDEECNEGDMILDCCVCHSKVFKPISEVVVDEESQIANAGEECPYCFSVEGYKIVGQVKASGEEEASVDEEVSESDEDSIQGESDVAAKGSTWEEFISNLEEENDVKVDSAYREKYTGEKIIFYKDGKSFEGEVTEYFNGDYELMNYNVHEISSENEVKEDNNSEEVEADTDVAEEVSDVPVSDFDSDEEDEVQESVKDRIIKCRMKDKRIDESIDLLTKDNTIASLLRDNMDKLSVITDVNELRDAIMDLVNESDIANKPAALKLKRDLYSKKSVGALLSTIGTYMTGEKVIKVGRNSTKSRKESFKHRRITESKIPAPYDKYFVITNEDDELVGDTVGGVNLIAALEPKDPDVLDIFGYLTDDPDFPVVEIVRDRAYPVDLEELGESLNKSKRRKSRKESFKHRRTIKESEDSDFQSAKDMWEMEDPNFDFEEYVDEFYFRAVDELSKKYKDLDVEPSIQSGMGSVFASYTRNDGKKMEASWDYEYEVESLEGAFMDATSSEDFFTAVKSFIDKKLKNASEIEESIKRRRKFTEDIDTIRITDDNIEITMSDDESEEKDDSVLDNEEVSDELTVEPVSDEAKEQIDFNSIDRESAEDAIEESLKESFGNIKFFRCSNIVPRNNRFIVEGVIGFNSGRKRNTNFVFKPRKITESKVIFKGYSKELKESVKSMSLVCRNRGKKCIAESLKVSK